MKEWKIVTTESTQAQKWLNQWKHEYVLEIHGFNVTARGDVCILLTREKKSDIRTGFKPRMD